MRFYNELLVYGIYLIVNTIFFFKAVVFLGNKTSNKLGMWLILVAALIVIIEVVVNTSGVSILPSILFGDVIWILTADYSLYKFKK